MSRNPHAGALRHYRHKVKPDEREKLRAVADGSDAQGIEAGTGETEGLDPTDESPVATPCAQTTD